MGIFSRAVLTTPGREPRNGAPGERDVHSENGNPRNLAIDIVRKRRGRKGKKPLWDKGFRDGWPADWANAHEAGRA